MTIDSPPTVESRQNERRKAHWRALILHADWRADPTHIVNISEGGTCILSATARPTGAAIRIVLFVPDTRRNGCVHSLLLTAKVAYSVLTAEGFQLGLQFVSPEQASVLLIRAAMRQ